MPPEQNLSEAANAPRPFGLALGALLLFALFAGYYLATGKRLPSAAGPDYAYHNDAAAFIYERGRLAIFPQDEASVRFSTYGGTRTIKPPFAYLVAAATARLTADWPAPDLNFAFRRGNALLAAATVTILFYTLALYYGSYGAGFVGATLLGFLPQFAFLASYLNDDVAAVFADNVALAAMLRIYRRGTSLGNWLLLAAAGGLILSNKQTAWILLPVMAAFCAFFVRFPLRRGVGYFGLGALIFVLAGGWWIGFNVYHYGLGDPFAHHMTDELALRHTRFGTGQLFSFRDHGVGYGQLLLGNFNHFLDGTFVSMIGNLDWLRLRVGIWQYGLYAAVIGAAAAYFLGRTVLVARAVVPLASRPNVDARRYLLELLLFVALLAQFAIYVDINVNENIQVQGRYLLPVFAIVIVLAWAAIEAAGAWMLGRFGDDGRNVLHLPLPGLRATLTALALFSIAAIHADAMVNYVIPYYRGKPYEIELRDFRRVRIEPAAVSRQSPDVAGLDFEGRGVAVHSTGNDPYFFWDPEQAEVCNLVTGNFAIWLDIEFEKPGLFQLYVDKGYGIREHDSYKKHFDAGRDTIMFIVAMPACRPLRFDPMQDRGLLKIRELRIAPLLVGSRL